MQDKHPIHTTLSTDAMRILDVMRMSWAIKTLILERALLGMDKLRFKERIDKP